jgi:multidrug resistance protein
MAEILRDSVFGHGIRLITGNKYFQYPEEKDLSIWERCLSPEKSAQMAAEGRIESNMPIPNQDSETSSRTIADDAPTEKASGDLPTDSPSTLSPTEKDIENMDFANGPDEKADEPRGILNYLHEGDTTARPRTNEPSSTTDQVERTRSSSLRSATTNKSERLGLINRIDTSTSTQAGPPLEPIINTISGVKVDPEKGQDLHVVDWYGPDDPENPMNWSRRKKFFVTFEICLLTTSVYIGSAIFSAGIESVVKDFGVSQVAATLGLCLFVAGYGIGPMLWAPMSEIPQIGRNPIYIGTLVLFVILQVPTALATNFGMLLAFRFITGFVGSPVLATGGASLADMYRPSKRAYAISIWGVAAVCGPVMGPLVGGFAAEAEGWTWTIWELMWFSGASLVFLFFLLPETSSSNILYRRARRLRKLTGDSKLKTEGEIVSETMTTNDIILMVLVRPITLNFHEPMVFVSVCIDFLEYQQANSSIAFEPLHCSCLWPALYLVRIIPNRVH